jgi:hypothetical protein
MDTIASAGGTTQAFIIDAAGNVSQAFLDALKEIRGQSLACAYQIPPPPSGQELDYNTLNVEHTPPNSTTPTTILYVRTADACDPTAGGWYYDSDPASGGHPTTIVMCPATCSLFTAGGEVQISVGCKTVVAPPR